MKLIFLSEKIYETALKGIVDFLINPAHLLNPGIVTIDRKKLLEKLPEVLADAARNPKRLVNYKQLPRSRILEIKTHSNPERSSTVVVFSTGFQYTSHSQYGQWCFTFDSEQINFYGRRNSFAWGRNALFSYEPEDIEVVITFQTSAPEKPFIFKGLLIPELRPATEKEIQKLQATKPEPQLQELQ